MRTWGRTLAVTVAAAASLTGLAACSEAGISESDAYKIGCPAIDAVVAGGSLGSKATVAGLEKLREQPDLSAQTEKWLDAAIGALKTTDPNAMPAGTKSVLVDGCAKNGYALRNLK
jgi:hypothetical protein